MKILIAHDGSKCADEALDDLKQAGLPEDTEALVLSAGELSSQIPRIALMAASPGYYFPDDPRVGALNTQQQQTGEMCASRAAERLRAIFTKWRIESEPAADDAQTAILRKAANWKPDLIVVGSHGKSGFRRFFLGSVSQEVVIHARCSVRISRRHPRVRDGAIRVLVGIDGSPDAKAALGSVAARSWPAGAEVRVAGVLDSRSWLLASGGAVYESNPSGAVENELRGRVSETLQSAVDYLSDAGILAVPVMLAGNPGRALVDEAEQWDADCIFVGARGLNALERLFLGSVSTTVAVRTHCSVEVVRQP